MRGMEVRFSKEGREWRLPGFLHEDDLVLYGESENDQRVGHFSAVCRRRYLKVNAGKSKVMVLREEKRNCYVKSL